MPAPAGLTSILRRMPSLYLVRHGQASFGAADYDQLSALGLRQSERLGRYWRAQEQDGEPRFGAVLTGTLRRHAQTWAGIARGLGIEQTPLQLPGLDEYNSEALIAALRLESPPEPATASGTPGTSNSPEFRRHHFRLLRTALQQWMAGRITPQGMPSYADFSAGVRAALDHVREHGTGDVLIVSSGGPIATAVAQVLHAPAEAGIELNLRIRNSAVTEFDYNPKRMSLVSFNTIAHLDGADAADWITYA